MHQDSGTDKSLTAYRFNYYPLAANGRENTTGFGAHTDFTTISFLFSNDSEGFQVSEQSSQNPYTKINK